MNHVLEFFKDYDRCNKSNVFKKEGDTYDVRLWLEFKDRKIGGVGRETLKSYIISFPKNTVDVGYSSGKNTWDHPSPMNKRQKEKVKKIIIKLCLKKELVC